MYNYLNDDILHAYLIDMFADLSQFDRDLFAEITQRVAAETAEMLADEAFIRLHTGFEICAWSADLVEYMVRIK